MILPSWPSMLMALSQQDDPRDEQKDGPPPDKSTEARADESCVIHATNPKAATQTGDARPSPTQPGAQRGGIGRAPIDGGLGGQGSPRPPTQHLHLASGGGRM